MKKNVFITALLLMNFLYTIAQEEVQITSKGFVLYGTLQKPVTKSEKAVLLIAGSGKTNRDGNTFPTYKNDGLKKLSEALTSKGYATLRYDKRGVGKSVSDSVPYNSIRFDDYITDASKWIDFLKKQYKDITIIGHSQGGLVGMLAIQQSSVNRFISLAGISEDVSTTIKRQVSKQPDFVKEALYPILDSLKAGKKVKEVPSYLNVLVGPDVQDYMMSFMKYDPRIEIKKIKIPTLIIQGNTDIQITVEEARALSEQSDYATLKVISNMNHVLRESTMNQAENIATYNNSELPLHKDLAKIIEQFLKSASN